MIRIYERVIRTFGRTNQLNKTVEELLELSVDVIHYRDKKVTLSKVIGEVCDVEIMMQQLKIILRQNLGLNVDQIISEVKKEKLDLLNKTIINKQRKTRRGKK